MLNLLDTTESPHADCILAQCKPNGNGYGTTYYMGKRVGAHVAAYLKHHNLTLDAVKGLVIMHTCDVRMCINPDHLVLGTQSDNIRDAIAKGRMPQFFTRKGKQIKLSKEVLATASASYVFDKHTQSSNIRALAESLGVHWQHLQRSIRAYRKKEGLL